MFKSVILFFLLSLFCGELYAVIINEGETKTYSGDYKETKDLTVNGTLIVYGTFEMGSTATLTIGPNAIIIVGGDFIAANKVDINATGIFIIGGSLTIKGDAKGSLVGPDGEIAQVYIGGDVNIKDGNIDDYPVLEEGTGDHEDSNNSYGNIVDLVSELPVVFEEYKDVFCGSGIFPGSIGSNQTICIGDGPAEIVQLTASTETTYQWFFSIDSTDPNVPNWTEITGATQLRYTPGALLQTTSYYRQVQKGNGCIAYSNVVTVTVEASPLPIGIYHE